MLLANAQPLAPDPQQVLDEIRALMAELDLCAADVDADADLVDDLELDSLDRIDLLLCLEEQFDVALRDAPLDAVRTVRDVADRVVGALRDQRA